MCIKSQLKIEFLNDTVQIFIKTLKEQTLSQVLTQNLISVVEVYDYIVNRTNALEKESNHQRVNNQFKKLNFKNPPKFNQNRFQNNPNPKFNNYHNNYKFPPPSSTKSLYASIQLF